MKFNDLLDEGLSNVLSLSREKSEHLGYEGMHNAAKALRRYQDYYDLEEYFESKNKIIAEGFDLKKYGFSFANAGWGFSYPRGYRIPFAVYKDVFGDTFNLFMYMQMSFWSWRGNCFGMCVVAILHYLKKLSLGIYEKANQTVPESAYDHIYKTNQGMICCLDKDSELTTQIERYLIYQFSAHACKVMSEWSMITENEATRMQVILNKIREERTPFVVCILWKRGGHALTVDSIRTPQNLGNGWHRVFLYDPNNPYHKFYGEKPVVCYEHAENRFVDINVDTGDWRMSAMVNAEGNAYSEADEIGSQKGDGSITFIPVDSFPGDFTEKVDFMKLTDVDMSHIIYAADSLEVYTDDGDPVCTVENGVFMSCDGNHVINIPVFEYALDGKKTLSKGNLLLKKGNYRVKNYGGYIAWVGDDRYSGVVASETVSVIFEDHGAICVKSESEQDVNIVLTEREGEQFVSYMTDIAVDSSYCRVSVDSMDFRFDTDLEQWIDVRILTEQGESVKSGVRAYDRVVVKGRHQSGNIREADRERSK